MKLKQILTLMVSAFTLSAISFAEEGVLKQDQELINQDKKNVEQGNKNIKKANKHIKNDKAKLRKANKDNTQLMKDRETHKEAVSNKKEAEKRLDQDINQKKHDESHAK